MSDLRGPGEEDPTRPDPTLSGVGVGGGCADEENGDVWTE